MMKSITNEDREGLVRQANTRPSIIGGSMYRPARTAPRPPGPMLSSRVRAHPITAAWGHTTSFAAAVVPDVSTKGAIRSSFV